MREWLHDSAPSPAGLDPGATNGYWRFTRNAVLQGKRTGKTGAGLVEELDPDAVNRDEVDEKGLAPDDAVSTVSIPLLAEATTCASTTRFSPLYPSRFYDILLPYTSSFEFRY